MKHNFFSFTSLSGLMLIMCVTGPGISPYVQAETSFWDAMTGGKVDFSARYRFEHVEDDRINPATGLQLKDADASTIRTTLGYKTGQFHHFGGRILLQDVRTVGPDDYNDATGKSSKTAYAVVADPEDTDFVEAYLSFDGLSDTVIKAGRQFITYREAPFHRYMGTILWRQNWQNHDAVSVVNTSLPDTKISYAYSWNINRIFTDEAVSPKNEFDSNSHFINLKYSGFSLGKLEGYAYLLDFDNAEAFSTNTYGLRFNGAYPVTDNFKAIYTAEYAHQTDAGDNPGDIDANYFLGELGGSFNFTGPVNAVTVKFSYELQQGEGGADRFVTILGTNHAYQGWADRFLITPGDGVEDLYVTLVAKFFGAKFIASYHDLNSDNLGYDYGEELDLLLTKTFYKHYTLGFKYADYDADESLINIAQNGANSPVTNDASIIWAFAQIKF